MGVIELDVQLCDILLPNLRAEVLKHSAFTENTTLEMLAGEFGVKIILLTKVSL
jgi:hypothetical protein